jgi:hypothetical protein
MHRWIHRCVKSGWFIIQLISITAVKTSNLTQFNSLHTLIIYFFKLKFNTTLSSVLTLSKFSLRLKFSNQNELMSAVFKHSVQPNE